MTPTIRSFNQADNDYLENRQDQMEGNDRPDGLVGVRVEVL